MRKQITISRTELLITGLACLLCAGATNACAQTDLLTVREAELILDLVPAVAESNARGGCPSYSVLYGIKREITVQVREACPAGGFASTLVDNYVIDRKTGAVAVGLDPDSLGPRIVTPMINSITTDLLHRAQARMLSGREAECLVLAAAHSAFGGGELTGAFFAKSVTGARGEWRFSVDHRVPDTPGVAVRLFNVRSDTASVRDDRTGEDVVSSGLALLTSRILSAKKEVSLSVDDALRIALQIPSVAGSVANGCSELVSSGAGTSEEMYIELRSRCSGAANMINIVGAVSAQSGHVTDPRTHRRLDSPESEKMAKEILRRRQEQLTQDKLAVSKSCGLN